MSCHYVPKSYVQQYARVLGVGRRRARAPTYRTWCTPRTGRSTGTSYYKILFTINCNFFRPYNFNPKNNICYALNIYDIFINYKSYVSSVHFLEGLSIDKVNKFSLDLSFDDNALKSFLMHSKFEITT